MRDRRRGALIGLAVGDALGAPFKFELPGDFAEITGFRGGGPHQLLPGEWTDDAGMALALAESIATAEWDLNDQAGRYIAWWREGRYTVRGRHVYVGVTTRHALGRFEETGDARVSGDPSEQASGNASIMRLAPVPIRYATWFPDRVEDLLRLCVESSLPTHASPLCLSSCAYLGLVMAALVHGVPREEVLMPDWDLLARARKAFPLHAEVEDVARGSFRRLRPPQIVGSGYVVKSLEAALWAFHDAADFRQAVLRAVNLGDDTDTTGAVCGQLAGACWGESGIPAEWRAGLQRFDLIEHALKGLIRES
jgi:ADP-ribosylglycohydrolase